MPYTTKPKKKKKKGKRLRPQPGDLPWLLSEGPSSAQTDAWLYTRTALTVRSADGCSATVAFPAIPAPLPYAKA